MITITFLLVLLAGLVSVEINGRNIVPSYIGREQGLVNEMVHGIVKDDAGILWMGTNKGMINMTLLVVDLIHIIIARGLK